MQWRQSENVETNFLFFLEIFIGLREGGRRRKGLGKFKTRRKNKWTVFLITHDENNFLKNNAQENTLRLVSLHHQCYLVAGTGGLAGTIGLPE